MTLNYCTHPTPLGELLLVTRNGALVNVGLPGQNIEPPRPATVGTHDTGEHLGAITQQFDEYFSGQRTTFDMNIDISETTDFRRAVLEHLVTIPYGETRTYTQVAEAVGRPRAVRAVGSACATNPVPIVIPCHRVLRSDGSLGGYAGGLDMKRTLLELEQ
ncbi:MULTISPECIES: methylated-DNA--[protein]-cysteine S-methyltransferase [Brevibacterium]|uniref:methylated-DNA--[protein]-cysteine S-methyltransferase n=1 Tax=Brevibacterium TaxID=1696 RepID=UPI001EF3DA2E|nr:methylated-DNA--[protein]-cysteine S-methyltransferase [Brevibacterium sp. ACRRH]MCG7297628.1 methylated-DNA--[protein]-cysteine S-methyltransferase [Brevibacterium sp. ACRRH]